MSHMVIFRTPEGKPGYQPAETVQDAVAVVERLRNDEGVENVRIFRLEELTFEYRPYYKVEIAGVTEPAQAGDTDGGDTAAPVGSLDEASEPESSGGSFEDDAADDLFAEGATGEGAIDVAHHEIATDGESSDAGQAEPASASASTEHPPWAAPPPPPPGASTGGVFEGPSDDEFSGTGQRRGLFGR